MRGAEVVAVAHAPSETPTWEGVALRWDDDGSVNNGYAHTTHQTRRCTSGGCYRGRGGLRERLMRTVNGDGIKTVCVSVRAM